jgi:hypothetical protein
MTRAYLGDGTIEAESNEPDVIASLQRENRGLREDLLLAKHQVETLRAQNRTSVQTLRRQLEPLYRALQSIFGEIEQLVGEDGAGQGGSMDARVAAVWESWKRKLGGTVAKGIDALLLHGELDAQQLAIAAGLDKRTVTKTVIYKLNQAGLINKRGGRFSLKPL